MQLYQFMRLEGIGRVEVLGTGHSPDTAMVKSADGRKIEVDIMQLRPEA